jgi:hypothetical protein
MACANSPIGAFYLSPTAQSNHAIAGDSTHIFKLAPLNSAGQKSIIYHLQPRTTGASVSIGRLQVYEKETLFQFAPRLS